MEIAFRSQESARRSIFRSSLRCRRGSFRAATSTASVDQFLVDNGALVRINDAGREHGVIVAQQNSTYDWTRAVPTLVMRNEDYGRIARFIADDTP